MALNAVRVVLAALLAAGLVAASLPAVEDATVARSATAGDATADRIAAAVDALLRNDATAPGLPGARHGVDVQFPGGILGDRIAYVAVGGVPGTSTSADGPHRDVVAYRLHGQEPRIAAVLPVDLRAVHNGTPAADRVPLVVRADTTVVLRLVEREGRPVVHTFMRGKAATGGRG